MFVLFNIFSCVVLGILLALVLSGGLVLLMIKLFAPVRIKPLSWILLLSMTILVCYQSVLLVGGFYAKGYVNDIGNGISTFIDASRITIDEVNSSLQVQVLDILLANFQMKTLDSQNVLFLNTNMVSNVLTKKKKVLLMDITVLKDITTITAE